MDRRALAPALIAGAGAAYLLSTLMADTASVSDKLAYIRAFGPIDLAISAREGWLPGVLTGWSAMESNWGKSQLAVLSHNVFGVKAGPTWRGQGSAYRDYPTFEWINGVKTAQHAYFREYPSWEASAEDLVHMLKITDIFKPAAAKLTAKDIAGFLAAIGASGYSTAPKYGDRILSFMHDVAQTVA